MTDYLYLLRLCAPSPISFKEEIHNILYLSHNNHIDLVDNRRVLTKFVYGYIFNQEAEDIWHITPIYRRFLYVSHSTFIKCTINSEQINTINKKRNSLLKDIETYRIIKDMRKTTLFIINKNLDKMKINQTICWI